MAKQEARHNDTPVSEVPEVAAFEEVKQRYSAFRSQNPDFFQYLDTLLEEYNDKLNAAIKATRDRQVSCGDFHLYQWKESVNYEQLYQSLGYEAFMAVGGKTHQQTIYDGDKSRVKGSIAAGKIPAVVAEVVFTKSPVFHKPEKAVMP